MTHERAQNLLEKAEAELRLCQKHLQEESPVDLRQFDEFVRDFCEVVSGLPKNEAALYKQALEDISGALEIMSDVLVIKRDDVKQKMDGSASAKKGYHAYAKNNKLSDS